MSEEVNSKVPS